MSKFTKNWRGAGGGGTGAVGGDGGAKRGAGGGGGAGWYDTSSATLVKTRQGGSLASFGRAKIRFVEFSDDTADSICIAVCDESLRSAISGQVKVKICGQILESVGQIELFISFNQIGSKSRKKSDMFIPDNFEDDDKAFYHEVNRDNGKSKSNY